MAVLIDTNIIIGFLKEDTLIIEKIREYIKNKMGPSKVPELLEAYDKFLLKCEILNLTRESAEKAADIYAQSQGKGITIKEKDCQIAGITLVDGITEVYTKDAQDFSRIFDIVGLKYIV